MADTTFTDNQTVIVADWLNDVNDVIYTDAGGVGGLSSTATGKGASLIGIEDSAGNFTATTVEGALKEHVEDTTAHTASSIVNTPAGNIAATDVQAAINELDTDKVPESDFSAFGKTLVDDATAKAAKDTLQIQVDGLTELRGLTPVDGEILYLKYHTTQGDGGHGVFEALTTGGPYTDDDGVTIVPTGGDGSSCWRRKLTHFIHSDYYGLLGDDSTDNTANGQSMLDTANTLGMKVVFGKGVYKGNWTWPSGVVLEGAGVDDTELKAFADAPTLDVELTSTSMYLRAHNFQITGNASFTSQDGIKLNTTTASTWVDTISLEGPLRIVSCGQHGINAYGTSTSGPFVQRLVMNQVTVGQCVGQGYHIGDYVYETLLLNCWQFGCGSGTSPANFFGGRRLTWISGGNNQRAFQEGVMLTDASITSGTNALTSPSNPFVVGDVGKTVAVLGAKPFGGVLITTIAGYVGAGSVTLTDNATATVSGGEALIRMLPMSAPLNLVSGDEISFINCNMEQASVYIKTDSGARNINVQGGRFAGSNGALAVVVNGTSMEGISLQNYTLHNTGGFFYVLAAIADDGTRKAMATTRNVNINAPTVESTPIYGDVFFRNHGTTIATGVINVVDDKHAAITVDTESAAASDDLDSILDYSGGTSRFYNGQRVTLSPENGTHTVVIKHGTGNIALHSQLDFSMATANDAIELEWFSGLGKWIEIGRTNASAMSAYTVTNVTTDRTFDADTVAIAELADVVGTLIADLQSKNYIR